MSIVQEKTSVAAGTCVATVENPLAAARKRRGMNLAEYSIWSGLSDQTLLRTERGLNQRLVDAVVEHLLVTEGIAPDASRAQYQAWRDQERKRLEQQVA